jgi:hypothetical protein
MLDMRRLQAILQSQPTGSPIPFRKGPNARRTYPAIAKIDETPNHIFMGYICAMGNAGDLRFYGFTILRGEV